MRRISTLRHSTASLLALSIALFAPLGADQLSEEEDTAQMGSVEVKEVGPVSPESATGAKHRNRWYRIGMAIGAVAVATVAIILASSNDGRHS